jgi:uncharacterized protein (TIGR00730 family)
MGVGGGRDEAAESARFVEEIRRTAEGLLSDDADRGDVKLIARALSELRVAIKVLSRYRHRRKVTMFGSARTPPDDPVYKHAVEFGRAMAREGYMVVTGGGPGIMEAGHVGAGPEASIGINIVLPFEQAANTVIAGDEKLIHTRYFFTRKLLFLKESDAVVLFPGGFGTLDEGFEALTLLQTGRAELMPIVLVDAPGGSYWTHWDQYVRAQLFDAGLISEEDLHLYKITSSIEEAVREITGFYRVFHSQRYVRGRLVLRLNRTLDEAFIERLNRDFADMLTGRAIRMGEAHADEFNEPQLADLPRLYVPFDRKSFGRLRQMIDRINAAGD